MLTTCGVLASAPADWDGRFLAAMLVVGLIAALAGLALVAVLWRRDAVRREDFGSARVGESDADAARLRLEAVIERAEGLIRSLENAIAHLQAASESVTRDRSQPMDAIGLAEPQPTHAEPAPIEPTTDSEALTADVLRLAESGFDAVEIARRLDETTGKVELVLALHRAR